IEGGKVIIAVSFTLLLAMTGAAYWALVLGNVIASLVTTAFVLVAFAQRWSVPRVAKLKPALKIMAVFGRVMPMMVAAAQHDREALRRYFLLFTELLAILIIPASAGLA